MASFFGLGENSEVKHIEIGKENFPVESESDMGQIALDIVETPKSIIIVAPIAGVELEDIDLTLNKSVLTLKGERPTPHFFHDTYNSIRNSECYWGKFSRNIILPENLDFEMIQAIMENNLLQITIPKLHIVSQNIKINRIE